MNMEQLRQYAMLYQLQKELEAKITTIESLKSNLGTALYEEFIDDGTDELILKPAYTVNGNKHIVFKDDRARKMKPALDPKLTVLKENIPVFYEWLKNNDFGHMVKEYVHPATATSWVKGMTEKNLPLPDCVTVFNVKTVKITKTRAK